MAQNYAASVRGAAIRTTRLLSSGATASGASASYVMSDFISVSFTPEYEEGDEITEKNAAGEVCVTFKSPDTLKRVNLEVAVCNPDPELEEMLAGGVILSEGGLSTGYAAPLTGIDPNPEGAALEVWSFATSNGTVASVNPYFRWLFPFVQLRPSGERVVENGRMAQTFEGWGVGNAMFGNGPQNDWNYTSDRAYAYVRTDNAPIGLKGYQSAI